MRLITFGDSWTAGHGVENDKKYKNITEPKEGKGFITKLRTSNSWPRYLSDKLDCVFVNHGVCGYGNLDILIEVESLCQDNILEKNDIIIIMFSYPHRYRLKKPKNDPIYVLNRLETLLKDYKHFYFNSFYPTFKDEEGFDLHSLPNCFINPTECVSDHLKNLEIENNLDVWEYGSRSVWNDEQKFFEGIYHPNHIGYKLIADYIYEQIKNLI